MITVKMVRDLGFEFVGRDSIIANGLKTDAGVRWCLSAINNGQFSSLVVSEFAWRESFELPENNKLIVDVLTNGGVGDTMTVGKLYGLCLKYSPVPFSHWRPSLKNWSDNSDDLNGETVTEQELVSLSDKGDFTLNDKQETQAELDNEQIEWDGNGLPPVGCEVKTEKGIGIVLSVSEFDGGVVTYSYNNGLSIACAWNNKSWINPVESPQQREERERLEAAYSIYLAHVGDSNLNNAIGMAAFKNSPSLRNSWLRVLNFTNYQSQKEGE